MSACVHYWLLPSPNGAETIGKCQNCGEEKAFSNYMDYGIESPWKRKNKLAWEDKQRREKLDEKTS